MKNNRLNISFILILSILFSIFSTIHTLSKDDQSLEKKYITSVPKTPQKGSGLVMSIMYRCFGKAGIIAMYWLLTAFFFFFWLGDYHHRKKMKAEEEAKKLKEQEQLAQLSKRKSWRKKQEQKRKKHNNF